MGMGHAEYTLLFPVEVSSERLMPIAYVLVKVPAVAGQSGLGNGHSDRLSLLQRSLSLCRGKL